MFHPVCQDSPAKFVALDSVAIAAANLRAEAVDFAGLEPKTSRRQMPNSTPKQ
jgi:hypothetical protein